MNLSDLGDWMSSRLAIPLASIADANGDHKAKALAVALSADESRFLRYKGNSENRNRVTISTNEKGRIQSGGCIIRIRLQSLATGAFQFSGLHN